MSQQKSLIIANWKMKLGLNQALDLAKSLKAVEALGKEIVICPSFASLFPVSQVLKNTELKLGAQDIFWEASGAYTGEVSASELRDVGCQFVIIGHSERRKYLGETDEIVHKKVKAALAADLVPIICVGETFDQRQAGAADYVLIQQVTKALEGIDLRPDQPVVVAYEPVWVIGTGQAIDPPQAGHVHQVIRQTLIDLFPLELVKNSFRIIYGGSVDRSNVSDFTNLENTSGVLVGNASLEAAEFIDLIKNAWTKFLSINTLPD